MDIFRIFPLVEISQVVGFFVSRLAVLLETQVVVIREQLVDIDAELLFLLFNLRWLSIKDDLNIFDFEVVEKLLEF